MPRKTWDFNVIADDWATQMGSAKTQTRYKNGIQGLTQSPMALAATPEAEQKYLDGIQAAVSSGKRRRKLTESSLAEYQAAALAKASHLGSGAQLKKSRYAKAMQPYVATYQSIQATLANMPKGGSANAKARSGAVIDALMQQAGTA